MNSKDTLIFVTGGTGFVGSYLLRYLVQEGYTRIRALKRTHSGMDLVQDVVSRVEWVEGDVLDPFSLQDAMEGVAQVFHCAAVISYMPKDKKRMREINVEGTANVVNEALAAGVQKMVFASSIAALGHPKEGFPATESTAWEWKKELSQYAVSKHMAELEAWRGAAEGLNVCVVNPSVILGAGRWHEGPLKIFPLIWRNFPVCPPGRNGFVDVRDVARIMIRIMQSPVSGERFIVSGANMDFQHLMGLVAHALGRRAPSHRASPWMMQAARYWDGLLAMTGLREREITREAVYHASLQIDYDNRKSVEALSWNYIPIADTVAEAGKLFVEAANNGMKPRVFDI